MQENLAQTVWTVTNCQSGGGDVGLGTIVSSGDNAHLAARTAPPPHS